MLKKAKHIIQCLMVLFGVFITPYAAHGAGLIVNEISNGPSGSKEFYELMVLGDAASPTADVDLDGWIIDDNNGDWRGSMTGIGISGGYARINTTLNPGSCGALNDVPPGSLLVIYNGDDVNVNVPPDDFSDSNNDGVYVFAAGSACIEICKPTPNSSSPVYSTCVRKATQDFKALKLRNVGDVAQVRDPSATFVHGFAYGDITTPYPTGSFTVSSLNGKKSTMFFNCGSWTSATNFTRASYTVETPGTTNSATNAIFQQKIKNGTFNYANPSHASNCSIDPDISVTKTSTVDSDPINASVNPKLIPGAEIIYSIFIENSGFGTPDGNTIVILEDLPTQTSIYVGNFLAGSPIAFIDGVTSSDLSLTFSGLSSVTDGIDFSDDGGASYSYTPVPDGSGFDDNVTHLKIVPTGTFAASDGTNDPGFTLQFKAKVN